MSFLAWIVLGLISGFIADKIVNKSGRRSPREYCLRIGIVGAVVGGWLFKSIGHIGVTGLDLYSILVTGLTWSSFWLLFRVRPHG
jgi:uncharacterized membrane protein YeaQ/YmgE (transglycosylase-associated protein family)